MALQTKRSNICGAITWSCGKPSNGTRKKDFKTLHLGRTSLSNEGLRRFKLGWGATEQRIEYVKYDLQHDRFLTDKDESSGWHNRIFNHLPIPLSRVIGAGLYRHWA